jgi:site-specific recombinase XerD
MGRKNNGDGSVYQRADGRWVAALQVGTKSNGKKDIRTRYAKTETEAKRKLKELKKSAYQNEPDQKKKHTLEKYMLEWFPRYKGGLKPAAYDRQEETIKYQILPYMGCIQMHSIVASDVKDLMNLLQYEKDYAYSTIKKAYDALNECFRQAVEDGAMQKNPCNKYNKPKESDFIDLENEDEDIRFLNDDEMERFCKEAIRVYSNGKPVYRLGYAFILILNTGIRLGEALALRRKGDINLCTESIVIDSSMAYVKNRDKSVNSNNYRFVEGLPKTKKSKRILPLNDVAKDAAEKLMVLNGKYEFLLANSRGNLTAPRNFARTLKCILVKAKIQDYGVHVLRHTFASALFRKGIDIKVISELLGHASVDITYDTYIHLISEQKG